MIKQTLLILLCCFCLVGAKDFNGSTDQIDYTNVFDPSSNPITVSMWVFPDSVTLSQYMLNVDDGSTTRNWTFLLSSGTGGEIQLQIIGSTALIRKSGTLQIATGSWQHLLVRGDGSTTAANYEIFVDGVEVSSYAVTTNGVTLTASTGAWNLGSRTSDDTVNYNGRMAHVGVWNRELSDAEVLMLADRYSPNCIPRSLVFSPDLVREVIDPSSGQSGTNDGTTVIAHPRMILCE